LIVNGQIAKYLKENPIEWRSAVEKKHKQLTLIVERKKTDNQIPLYQFVIDSALVRFSGYTHGEVAAAVDAVVAKSRVTTGKDPAHVSDTRIFRPHTPHTETATDPASTGDADDTKKEETADLEVATIDDILKPTDSASPTNEEAVGTKRDTSTTVTKPRRKRLKLAVLNVTAMLADGDVDEPQVVLKATATLVPDEIPEVLGQNPVM
jgi:hypothetical protein